jgi:hypothetical protein
MEEEVIEVGKQKDLLVGSQGGLHSAKREKSLEAFNEQSDGQQCQTDEREPESVRRQEGDHRDCAEQAEQSQDHSDPEGDLFWGCEFHVFSSIDKLGGTPVHYCTIESEMQPSRSEFNAAGAVTKAEARASHDQ